MIFFSTLVGPALVLVPLVTALARRRRGRHLAAVQAPFLASAVSLVTAAALHQDFGDIGGPRIPLLAVLKPGVEIPEATVSVLGTAGQIAVIAYLASVLWLFVALLVVNPLRPDADLTWNGHPIPPPPEQASDGRRMTR